MPCPGITVNALDASQDRLLVHELLNFQPVNMDTLSGHLISEDQEYDTFHRVLRRARKSKFKRKKTVKNGEACRIYGSFPVTKVQGDVHITAKGYAYRDRRILEERQLNFTHIIDELSFGEFYPKLVNPLDGVVSVATDRFAVFQYFMSVVPTTYRSFSTGYTVETNQYAVTEQAGVVNTVTGQPPGIFFKYDMEPIALTITDRRLPFSQFLVRLVNIIGGLVVCAGWLYKLFETTFSKVFGGNHNVSRGILENPVEDTTSEKQDHYD